MKFSHLAFLIVITIGSIYAASIFWDKRAPTTTVNKSLLFPELTENINRVKIVEIKGYEEQVILSHNDNNWFIQSSDNFPAISDQVKSLVVGLTELKIDSEKTKNPELYSRLSVEGPYERNTTSKLVSLLDENGEVIESLIIGKKRETNESVPALYVRKPDAEQALLVHGNITASSREKDWFQQDIINLDSGEVKSVTIAHPDHSPFSLSRDDEGQVNFNLSNIPDGKKPQSEVLLNRIARLLEDVRAESVRSTQSIDMFENSILTTIESFRGLVVYIRLKNDSGKNYANFQFEYKAPDVAPTQEESDSEEINPAKEIELLNNQMSPWVFEIPKFKYDDMTITLEKLIRD